MEQEDWKDILKVVQLELRAVGREDLADTRRYKIEESEGKSSRKLEPIEKHFVLQMLRALYKELYVRSPNILNASIENIGDLITEGNRPSFAFLRERNTEEGDGYVYNLISGDRNISDALSNLAKLIDAIKGIEDVRART